VVLRTIYVWGIARTARAHTLRGLLADVSDVDRRAVLDVDRVGALKEVNLLGDAAAAFEAAVRRPPASDALSLVNGFDPRSPAALGGLRRGQL